MDKKTSIAVLISVLIVFAVIGGVFWSSFIGGQVNQNETSMIEKEEGKLDIQTVTEGTGAVAVAGKDVTVHYTGVFTDGQKFDSSRDRGVPFTFRLGAGQVIKGWDIGVEGMKVGGKRVLVIPPQFGYGSEDNGPIPGNSTLVFEVELLEVK
jgi:FKBP-type peptidyl-prolyl cis-trans isomerase